MADRIKGITIEIGGDATGLNKALGGVNKEIRETQSQLKDVERLLKLDPSNTELLRQRQTLLADAVGKTKDKLDTLKTAEKQVQDQFKQGKISEEQYDALKREIIETEEQLKKLEDQAGRSNVALQKISDAGKKVGGFGEKVTSIGQKMMKVSAGVTAVGAAGVAAWQTVDDAYDAIAKGTGATGDALAELQQSFTKVFSSVPTDAGTAGNAIADINTRFGFTNEVLEDCTKRFIQFADVNNTDVSTAIANVSRYMGDAGIESSKYGNVLDQLTAASQASGLGVDKLSESLTKYGAPMRALGFDTKESIAIFAGWEKAGVNTEIAFSGMKKAIGTWGKEGKDAREEFKKTLKEIEECPDIATATGKAIEVFGQKAGPDLADAIQGGRFAYEDFLGILNGSSGQLEQTFNDTLDPIDKVKVSMQELTCAGAELGGSVLEVLSPILEKLIGVVKRIAAWFSGLSDGQKQMIVKIGLVVAAIGPLLVVIGTLISSVGKIMYVISALSGPIGIVIAVVGALVAAFIYLWNNCEGFRNFWIGLWDKIKNIAFVAINALVKFFTVTIPSAGNAVVSFFQGIPKKVVTIITSLKNKAVDGFKNLVSGIKEKLRAIPKTVEDCFQGAVDFITSLPGKAIQWGRDFINGLVDGIKASIKNITSAVSGVADEIRSFLHFSRPDVGPLREYEKWMPDMMKGLSKGIKTNMWRVTDQIEALSVSMQVSPTVSGVDKVTTNLTAVERMMGLILQSVDGFGGMTVVLDDGTLVGRIMPKIDQELQQSQKYYARGGRA